MDKATHTIYVFGNSDHPQDNIAIAVAEKLASELPNYRFIRSYTVDQFDNENHANRNAPFIILDAAKGIDDVQVLNDLDSVHNKPTTTLHDFDIGFELRLLKKLGKIQSVQIIAIPLDMETSVAAKKVRSILLSSQFRENLSRNSYTDHTHE